MSGDMQPIEKLMRTAPVIPVLVIDDIADARPIAQTLVANGLRVLEVVLRTEAALDIIREMRKVDGAIVGAGTITNPDNLDAALLAGAEFIVSPGLTEDLGKAVLSAKIPFLPGIASASDIMRGMDMGFRHFKFFPAEASGGIPSLKALSGPFGQCLFCPTGGINAKNAVDWLALKNVLCVGGSWLVPKGSPDLDLIGNTARTASTMNGHAE